MKEWLRRAWRRNVLRLCPWCGNRLWTESCLMHSFDYCKNETGCGWREDKPYLKPEAA